MTAETVQMLLDLLREAEARLRNIESFSAPVDAYVRAVTIKKMHQNIQIAIHKLCEEDARIQTGVMNVERD